MKFVEIEKMGSAVSNMMLSRRIAYVDGRQNPKAGDLVVVKALSESTTYGN